ncbi:MAG: PAS-domain containing protein, partial [Fimbriimonadaceae bacterium]|nr:PAS-domain containing protein [Alphaproteobacteria bacterium]
MSGKLPGIEQLRLMQAALDHISQGFSVMDKDLRLVGWNKRFFELLDLPQYLAKRGTHFSEFIRYNAEREEYGEGDIEELVAERVAKAKTFEPHYLIRERPTGEIIAIRGFPLPEGGFVTTYTDVTDQHKRQEALELAVAERTSALRESEQRLRLITNAIPALIAYVDTEPSYTFANQRYAEWFGYTTETILDTPVATGFGPELFRELEPKILLALNGQEITYDYRRKGPNGLVSDMRTTLLPDLDAASGAVRGCFVLSLDVTEQKEREAVQHQAQKMEAVGQLTGGVAHDFNNLLTIVLGNLIGIRARAIKHPELEELVEPAIDAANRGANLVNRLLAFARGRPVDPRPVDVAAVVAGLSPLLRRTLPSSLQVEMQVKGTPCMAMVDRSQLENALLNLALNARAAMPRGGRLTVTTSRRRLARDLHVDDEMLPAGDYVEVSVTDTGCGMPVEVLKRAFEPFYTTKEVGEGSGLGLSMVYG